MKKVRNIPITLLAGLLVFILSLSTPITTANAGHDPIKQPISFSDADINALLDFYAPDKEVSIRPITVKVFDANDELIFSEEVCQKAFDCDERLNQLLIQSDFITDVDNVRIFKLTQ